MQLLAPAAAGLKLSRIAICSRASRVNIHKQQHHHSPSGCAFLRDQLQVRGADPLLVAKRKRGPKFGAAAQPRFLGLRKLQPAPVLTQRPRTCPGNQRRKDAPTPTETRHRSLTRSPPHATCKKQHAFPLVFRRLKLCAAEAPPAAATFLQPRADLKAAPGKERKDERFRTARNSATNTSPSPPFPPPVFNVANGNARKAS